MKAKNLFFLIGIVFFILSAAETQAQKRVHVKNSRTSAYRNKTPKAKVNFNHNSRASHRLKKLPQTSISLKYRGVNFHYNGGKYYRHYAGNYINIIPPLGIQIRVLPSNYMTFVIGSRAYYYVDGIYYTKRRSGRVYEVVEAPIGAIVHHLPMSAERIQIDNQSFFQCNLTVYSKIRSSQGHAYKVVGHLKSYGNHY